ncbi:hypothetical protein HYU96_03305 [Candidatus Daviesbacteria bacterium]|nr:hypothetical protein [Candidatus Daviesbacteria bacterium]
MPQNQPPKKGRGCLKIFLIVALILIVLPILLIGGFIYVGLYGLMQSDEDILKNYQPPPHIAEIAERTTMTTKAKGAFYRGDPEFISGESFRKECLESGELAGGCKKGKVGKGLFGLPTQTIKIYLLQIDDPRFRDNRFGTGAHEMLHVAYSRLGTKEKEKVNVLIDQEIANRQNDESITARVEAMKRMKKNYYDELHAFFGTDYADLAVELDEYYQRYFTDRRKLVAISTTSGFNIRVRKLDQLKVQLTALEPRLRSLESQVKAGDESKIPEFNSLVGQYNSRVAETNRVYSEIKEFYQYIDPAYQPPASR